MSGPQRVHQTVIMGVEPTLETESLASTKIAALILCVCLLFFHAVRRRYGQGLNKFDGPFLSSFTDFWKLLLVSSNRSRIITADLHERYGDIVRLGPRKLSFGDPRALKEIYGINKGFVKVTLFVAREKKMILKIGSPIFTPSPPASRKERRCSHFSRS